jgi:N-acetylmuramoyl-L-alanine amidase
MKLCIEVGHGMSNKRSGVYDTGAVYGPHEEASIVLLWGHELRKACEYLGMPCFMTRVHRNDPTPLGTRVARAEQEGCTHLISLHVNDADAPGANGFETLYRTPHSEVFAESLHHLMSTLNLRDRGVKLRPDLAVLTSKSMPSALLELGFIRSASDMRVVTDPTIMQRHCAKIATYLAGLSAPARSAPEPAAHGCTCPCTCGKRPN